MNGLAEKIKLMSPEQKAQVAQVIQAELASRQAGGTTDATSMTATKPRGFLPTATSALDNMPNALSIAIRGKPIDSSTDEINKLVAKINLEEALKAQTPEGRLKRREAEVALGEAPTTEVSAISAREPSTPVTKTNTTAKAETYIRVPKGQNKYGVMEYDYKLSPESEAEAQAMKTRATKGAEQEAAMKPALNIVRTLKQDWIKAFPDAPTVGMGVNRFEHGAKKSWEAFTQEDPEAAAYLNTRKAYLSLLVRGLGEKGVLTNPDIERVASAIGSQWDTKTVALDQFDRLEKLLSADMQNYIASGGNPAIIESVVNSINMQSPESNGGRKSKPGGQVMIDAQGNKAMVYPDGSFEEM